MYSAYKLNKHGNNIQSWCTSLPICNQSICSVSGSNCCFLTCIQVSQEAGKVVWYSHLLKNFPQFVVIYTVKGFGIINKVEVDVFLESSFFFYDPMDVGNLISGSSAFSKSSLSIWKFMLHVLLKPGLENFEHCFASLWDECSCAVVWLYDVLSTVTMLYFRSSDLVNLIAEGLHPVSNSFLFPLCLTTTLLLFLWVCMS